MFKEMDRKCCSHLLGISSQKGRCPMSSPSGHPSVMSCYVTLHTPHLDVALRKDVHVVRTWGIGPFGNQCPTTPYWNPPRKWGIRILWMCLKKGTQNVIHAFFSSFLYRTFWMCFKRRSKNVVLILFSSFFGRIFWVCF